MKLKYQVVNEFIEKNHENTIYKKGEVYPKEGFTADPERVTLLQSSNNDYKKPFLGPEIQESEETGEKMDSTPEHKSKKPPKNQTSTKK
jgi:hypothetical protein